MRGSRVTVVIPLFNRRRVVADALASVAAQTLPPARLIVVDDGSTDGGSQAVLRWFVQSSSGTACRLITQANQGVSAARNRGLDLADDHEFVAFLDSDDVWPPDFLERTVATLSSDPRAVAVTTDRCIETPGNGDGLHIDSSALPWQPAVWMLQHGANLASSSLFRVAALVRRGGFDTALRTGEDSALFLPLSLDGPWLHAPGRPVVLRQGLAEALGDEGNLSARFFDNRRTWAAIYERFFTTAGLAMVAEPNCRRLLAVAWYQAGCELVAQRAHRQAATCFRKAIAWRPSRARYYWHFARAWREVIWPRSSSNGDCPSAPTPAAPPARPMARLDTSIHAAPARPEFGHSRNRAEPAIIERG
ncbi:MAG: glycosyltransferase family 2 protein [Pirellulales bacterium]